MHIICSIYLLNLPELSLPWPSHQRPSARCWCHMVSRTGDLRAKRPVLFWRQRGLGYSGFWFPFWWKHIYLLGSLEHDFDFSIQLEISSSQLTLIFFRGVGSTTNQIYIPYSPSDIRYIYHQPQSYPINHRCITYNGHQTIAKFVIFGASHSNKYELLCFMRLISNSIHRVYNATNMAGRFIFPPQQVYAKKAHDFNGCQVILHLSEPFDAYDDGNSENIYENIV